MTQPADLMIINARAITLDLAQPQAEAVAVTGRQIAFGGSTADAAGLPGPRTRVIDAAGRTLLPGIIDSHYHLLWGALKLDDIRFEGVDSYGEMTTVVREYAAAHPDKPWLIGYGLGYGMLHNHTSLTRQ